MYKPKVYEQQFTVFAAYIIMVPSSCAVKLPPQTLLYYGQLCC